MYLCRTIVGCRYDQHGVNTWHVLHIYMSIYYIPIYMCIIIIYVLVTLTYDQISFCQINKSKNCIYSVIWLASYFVQSTRLILHL